MTAHTPAVEHHLLPTKYESQKFEKKLPIHENADANITCDFGDGDISRSRSFLSTTGATARRLHDDGTTDPQSRGLLEFNNIYKYTILM